MPSIAAAMPTWSPFAVTSAARGSKVNKSKSIDQLVRSWLRTCDDSIRHGSAPKSHSKIKVIQEFSAGTTGPIDERDHVREQFKENFSGIE
jgi:hypothetical protein